MHFFLWTCDLLGSQKITQRHFFFPILHPLSTVIFATATVLAFVLLCSSRFNFHCYTQHEATPTQKLARQWQLQPSTTSSAKDYAGHSLAQSSFAELPNTVGIRQEHLLSKNRLTVSFYGKTYTAHFSELYDIDR